LFLISRLSHYDGLDCSAHGALDLSGSSDSSPVSVEEVYSWASQLASESRQPEWIAHWYVWPDALARFMPQLNAMSGGVVGLVGLQGVGKSSTLLAILFHRMISEREAWRKKHKSYPDPTHPYDTIRFKWRRESELFPSLLDGTHEASASFLIECRAVLFQQLLGYRILLEKKLIDNPQLMNIDWAEPRLGKTVTKKLRKIAWLQMLREKKTILLDSARVQKQPKPYHPS